MLSIDSRFDDICYNQFCNYCKFSQDYCFPLSIDCPEVSNIHLLYNAFWISELAGEAVYQLDEDDNSPQANALIKCFQEQEELVDSLLALISKSVVRF